MKFLKYINYFKGLLIYLFLNVFSIYFFSFLYPNHKYIFNIINLSIPFLTCFILLIVYRNLFNNKFKDYKNNFAKYFNIMFRYWFVGVILMIVLNTLINALTGNIAINEENNRTLFSSLPLYSIISTIILAPISEELAFRASFKGISKNKYIYSFITAFIFGLLHVIFNGDFLYIVPYSALGYFIALSYSETDNILVPISMHAFHNTLCILLLIGGNL